MSGRPTKKASAVPSSLPLAAGERRGVSDACTLKSKKLWLV